jgi:hypothetical protein
MIGMNNVTIFILWYKMITRVMRNLQNNENESSGGPCSRWPFLPHIHKCKWKWCFNRPVLSYKRRSFTFWSSNLFWLRIIHVHPNIQSTGETGFPHGYAILSLQLNIQHQDKSTVISTEKLSVTNLIKYRASVTSGYETCRRLRGMRSRRIVRSWCAYPARSTHEER